MTLEGTNTWILRAPGEDSAIVIDPGPDHDAHLLPVLAAAGTISRILLTHGHVDHSAGAMRLSHLSGAKVLALDPNQSLGDEGLADGAVVSASGLDVRVWTTPGHTADSLCFLVEDEDGSAVLTGDTILGRGTTVIAHPDGVLGPYLDSLRRLSALGSTTVLPGHGPELADAGVIAQQYLDHREQRLDQVRNALVTLGPDASPRAVVELVYADVDPVVWWAAELSVRAQLDYLHPR
jgi:glyoxylase-like metal-dependent hydrolase (beta-lactamase superfamily II)